MEKDPGLQRIRSSRLARGWAATGPLLSIGQRAASEVVRRSLTKQPFGVPASEQQLLARRLVSSLGQLKGLLMKAGQVASFMSNGMPEEVRDILATLQDDTPAMPAEVIERVIERELGKPPRELFLEWDPSPIAAASIGQVHRARHRDGRALAVKVQYPDVEKAIDSDLKNAAMMNAFSGLLFRGLDQRAATAELRERMLEECDYTIEARNQEQFRTFYADRPEIMIPAVLPELSSKRVLSTEFAEGDRFKTFALGASQEERNRAGQVMLLFGYESILAHDMFNCDPHPGNYLFHGEGVVFLDFGSVKRFPPALVEVWRKMLRAVVERDMPCFTETVMELGIAPRNDPKFDFAYQFKIAEYLSLPWLEDRPFRFTDEYLRKSFSVLVFDNPLKSKMNVPRDLIFLNRLQWGLYAVLCTLGAEANWHRLMQPFLYPKSGAAEAPSGGER